MEKKSLAEILKHAGKSYSLKELPETSRMRLKGIENRVIDARLTGKSFCELQGNELRAAGDQVILKTAALYGCPLPQTDFFAEILTNELAELITNFGYGEFTLAEIELALRINTHINLPLPPGLELEKVNFTGNVANIYFISRVLSNYIILRNSVDRRLQNLIDGYE